MQTEFEIGDPVIKNISGRHGEVTQIRESRIPMIKVLWNDGTEEWLPPELIRKQDTLTLSKARSIFDQNDGEVTKNYYAEMNSKGLLGQLAVALFRAQKRSTAAKRYKGKKFRHAAYDVKNWSLSEVCRILIELNASGYAFGWGWGKDLNTPNFEWVLYAEIPGGQVSFHSHTRLDGPDYKAGWDGVGNSERRILAFCDSL